VLLFFSVVDNYLDITLFNT